MERRILIVSASIGTGHTQAARAIKEYWTLEEPDALITHVDFLDTDSLSIDNILKETYMKMIDVFPMLYDIVYRVSQGNRRGGAAQTVLSWLLKRRMLKLIQKERPDVIVFTHPFPCGAACLLKRHNEIDVPLIGVITDFSVHQFWLYNEIDMYYVGSDSVKEELENHKVLSDHITVTGIPIRREFFSPREVPYSSEGKKSVLIMGGGLGLGSVEEVLRRLGSVDIIDEFHVVAGTNIPLYEALMSSKDLMRKPTHVYGYTTDIPKLMKEATLLVTKPGALTCMEGVTVGVPMVFFGAIPGQEEANASLLEQKGCARWARDIHNLGDVVAAILHSPDRLKDMHEQQLTWRIDAGRNIVTHLKNFLDTQYKGIKK